MKVLKKVWSIFSTVVVVLMVLCAVFLMGSRLLGFNCYTVISGSMEPTYSVGDLLYVKKVDPADIKVGDPITFVLNEDLVVATHRVVEVDTEHNRFYTKGDANEIPDSRPVLFQNVKGVPQFAIPKMGYVSDFVQNPPGMYISIVVGGVLILLVFLPDLIAKKKKEGEETDAPAADAQPALTAAEEENERLRAELERLRSEMAAPEASADSADADTAPDAE